MNNKLYNKLYITLYGIISITFVILLIVEAFIRNKIKNIEFVYIMDYFFWYVFGLFSAFFLLRRFRSQKNKREINNLHNLN